MAEIGSLESDFDGNLALHIVETMNLKFHFLSMAIQNMIDCGAISVDKIMDNMICFPSCSFLNWKMPFAIW